MRRRPSAAIVAGASILVALAATDCSPSNADSLKAVPGLAPLPCSTPAGLVGGQEYVCFLASGIDHLDQSPVKPTAVPTNHGGPVQSSPTVYVVNWGASQSDFQAAVTLAQQGLDSPWSHSLAAYGVGAGKLGGTWVDTTPPPAGFGPSEFMAEFTHAAAANNWSYDGNTQFWFLVNLSLQGSAEVCGTHYALTSQGFGQLNVLGTVNVVTDGGDCATAFVPALAHEYAETATDPNTQNGVVGSATPPGQINATEVGDVCVHGGDALSPVGWLPMIAAPFIGCTWGEWAPGQVSSEHPPAGASLPSTWGQCAVATPCHGWLYYPSGAQVPSGHRSWDDPTSGQWVIVP